MDKAILLAKEQAIRESTPISTLSAIIDSIMKSVSVDEAMSKLLKLMSICSNSPCCDQPYNTKGCMSIECKCGCGYCGFCHKLAREIPELGMPEHVSACAENRNPFIRVRDGHTIRELDHKEPFPRDFYLFQVWRRMRLFNKHIALIVEKFGDPDVMNWFMEHAEVVDAIGGMFLDRDKYRIEIVERGQCILCDRRTFRQVFENAEPVPVLGRGPVHLRFHMVIPEGRGEVDPILELQRILQDPEQFANIFGLPAPRRDDTEEPPAKRMNFGPGPGRL